MQGTLNFEGWHRLLCGALVGLLLATAGMAVAQSVSGSFADRREVASALADARALAVELEAGIAARFQVPVGWECENARRPNPYNSVALRAVPLVSKSCRKGAQDLSVYLIMDPSTAEHSCHSDEHTKDKIARGRAKPDLFAFFETHRWRIKRSVFDLDGCSDGQLSLTVQGRRSSAAIAAGPALVDEFARAMLRLDVGGLVTSDTFARHQIAVERAVDMLATQARALEATLPAGSSNILRTPMRPRESLPATLPAELVSGPSVSASIEAGNCNVLIVLNASETGIHKARTTQGRWARGGGEDGEVSGAYIRRNTERFVGQDRVDGTGIQALVDERAIVSVVIPGNRFCQSDPDIVRRLFMDILSNDFRDFGIE